MMATYIALFLASLSLVVSFGSLILSAVVYARRTNLQSGGLSRGAPIPVDAFAKMLDRNEIDSLRAGEKLVVFATPTCSPCRDLVATLSSRLGDLKQSTNLLIVEGGNAHDGTLATDSTFDARWIRDAGGHIRRAFGANVTPSVFYVNHGIVVERVPVGDLDRIITLAKGSGASDESRTSIDRLEPVADNGKRAH